MNDQVSRPSRPWRKEPAPSTRAWIAKVPLAPTPKGLKIVLEVTAYHAGTKVALSASVIHGSPPNRTIRQSETLMFNDIDEAKDAIDELIDRLEVEAKAP